MNIGKAILVCLASVVISNAAVYEVGPGKPLTKIASVPWATLNPGDTVLIYWQSTPYKEKWAIGRSGTALAPITVRGVPNSSGYRPIIDGQDAVTPANLRFWNEDRGVLKIGGTSTPADIRPEYIVIEGLQIRNGRYAYHFKAANGGTGTYSYNAAGIYIEKGRNITIRNCYLQYNGNGLFTSPGSVEANGNFLIESNFFASNGNAGRSTEHHVYTNSAGITFQYNRFYVLYPNAQGNALKDRSAGTVIRYNWIEGGNRQLDLVEATFNPIVSDPRYRETFVYGNTLIELAGGGNRQFVHYGGDNGNTVYYRKGTLHFYNNTLVSKRTDLTAIFRPSTSEERVDARNNIFYTMAAGTNLLIADVTGTVQLHRNWLKPGWRTESTFKGTIIDDGSNLTGASPGFLNEAGAIYELAATSPNVDAGTLLNSLVLPLNNVLLQYKKHQTAVPRVIGIRLDVGAYEKR